MTKRELKQIYYLNKEIKLYQQQLNKIDKDDEKEKTELETIINGLSTKIKRQHRDIMEYISTLDDSFIRQIMTCRFIRLMSWTATAAAVGGGNTADGVRKTLDRFFEKK